VLPLEKKQFLSICSFPCEIKMMINEVAGFQEADVPARFMLPSRRWIPAQIRRAYGPKLGGSFGRPFHQFRRPFFAIGAFFLACQPFG
jgi:hypothetical protein